MRAKATTIASPSILVPPTIELLRLSELARQGVHRLGSLVHYVGAERVKPPGQRVDVVDRGAEPALHPIEPHAREDERVVALEDLEPRDDAVRADAVVPTVRSHESENLVPIAAREQRDAVAAARDAKVLLGAKQVESLLEEARLRLSDESLRPRRRDAHLEALGTERVAHRVCAHQRGRRPTRESLERADRVGEGGRRDEVGRHGPVRAEPARAQLVEQEYEDRGHGDPPERTRACGAARWDVDRGRPRSIPARSPPCGGGCATGAAC